MAGCASCLLICSIIFAIYYSARICANKRKLNSMQGQYNHLEGLYLQLQGQLAEYLRGQQHQIEQHQLPLEVGCGPEEGTEDEDNGYKSREA